MQAVRCHGPHELKVEDIEGPGKAPGAGEVLVRIERGGICGSDLHYYFEGGVGDFAVRYGAEAFGSSVYIRDPDGNIVELRCGQADERGG